MEEDDLINLHKPTSQSLHLEELDEPKYNKKTKIIILFKLS